MCGRGLYMAGVVHGREGRQRTVRILLECILVRRKHPGNDVEELSECQEDESTTGRTRSTNF